MGAASRVAEEGRAELIGFLLCEFFSANAHCNFVLVYVYLRQRDVEDEVN